MYKEVLTKHNFALSDGELLAVQYMADIEHHRSLTSALRAVVRDYAARNDEAIVKWIEGGMGR